MLWGWGGAFYRGTTNNLLRGDGRLCGTPRSGWPGPFAEAWDGFSLKPVRDFFGSAQSPFSTRIDRSTTNNRLCGTPAMAELAAATAEEGLVRRGLARLPAALHAAAARGDARGAAERVDRFVVALVQGPEQLDRGRRELRRLCERQRDQPAARREGRREVAKAACRAGRGELLEDGALFMLEQQPKDLARQLYDWAKATGKLGGVFTLAELEDDGPLAGADARLRTAALDALEAADRCAVFTGATSAEAGVKFFSGGGWYGDFVRPCRRGGHRAAPSPSSHELAAAPAQIARLRSCAFEDRDCTLENWRALAVSPRSQHASPSSMSVAELFVILAVSALFDGQSAPEELDRLGCVAELRRRGPRLRVVAAVRPLVDRPA